ncbi:PIG-L family deacetylase [Rhodopirellula sp. MGV]|uniref:PIG-L family deacetylase n=1 Tax=Rhodopirellula sp. MGV TaxID=2023130 RepID=UPI000B972773|nr:PIG-L family deacetylase [Rhodopirellula sp. MGV]OYP37282.1 LmbE family protein [Rhodopirellula sp. MGV]PNY33856.1 LmbE family protein [Rhodopirellula baltica]
MSKEPELPPPLDVVAVGAHPDDVEVACGGTLAKLAGQGYRVGIIDLTDGEPTPFSKGPESRFLEATQAAKALGVCYRIQMDLPNRQLFDCFEARVELAKIFRMTRPRVVIGFGDKSPMASPDHHQAMLLTDAAVFYSRLSKWDEQFDHYPPHVISRQLYFRLALEPMNIAGNPYHTLIDISDTLERKLASIRCYGSQFDHKRQIEDRVRAAAVMAGSIAGVAAAEPFAAARPFATDDFFGAVGLDVDPTMGTDPSDVRELTLRHWSTGLGKATKQHTPTTER